MAAFWSIYFVMGPYVFVFGVELFWIFLVVLCKQLWREFLTATLRAKAIHNSSLPQVASLLHGVLPSLCCLRRSCSIALTACLYLRKTPINLGSDSPNQACPGDSLEIFGSLGFVACVLAVDGLSQAN